MDTKSWTAYNYQKKEFNLTAKNQKSYTLEFKQQIVEPMDLCQYLGYNVKGVVASNIVSIIDGIIADRP